MLGLNLDCPLLLSTVIEHAATTFGDTELVSHSRMETVRSTYRDAALRSRRLASSLQRLGVEEGGFVGSLAWNTHRHFELFYGVSGIGGVLHTANPRLPPEQILYTINFTGYRTLFIDADTVALAEQLAPRLESVDRFIVMAARDDMPGDRPAERAVLRGSDRCRRPCVHLAETGRAERVRAVLHLRDDRSAEGRAVLASGHCAVGAVHRWWQRLGLVGQ